jgi:macrolide transport system ATP-binding/permease protein
MLELLKDIRFGFRRLRASPGFTTVAVLSLALGIGVNTSIFSLVSTVLLRPLPVSQPEQIVSVFPIRARDRGLMMFSYPNYREFRDRSQVFSGLVAFRFVPMSLSRGGTNERIWGYLASGNYFDVLGIKAALGRTFLPEEDRTPGTHPVAVLSYGCWQRRFGADPAIVGKTITVNSHALTVIGVAPKQFKGTEVVFAPDLWVPMMMRAAIEPGLDWLERRGDGRIWVVGRLKPTVTTVQAIDPLHGLAVQLGKQYPESDEGQSIMLSRPGLVFPSLRGPIIGFAGVLMAAVGLVLLLACTNLANLLLARASRRQREIAIRLSVGASRFRLIRQLLTESLLLSVAGGIVGFILALGINQLLIAFQPPTDITLALDLHADYRVLGLTALLSVLTGALFGLVPALQATNPELASALKERVSGESRYQSRWRNALVVAQGALSFVLLIAAGLVVRSLQHAQQIDPGFDSSQVAAISIDVGLQGYDAAGGQTFYRQMADRIRALPGIRSATLTGFVPLSLGFSRRAVLIEGRATERGANVPMILNTMVGLDYFQTMGIPLLEGRDFTALDREGAPAIAIVNEAFARRFWPGPNPARNALGKVFSLPGIEADRIEVVGVAKDGKYLSLGERPEPFIYLPLLQNYDSSVTLLVRTAGDPRASLAAIRREAQSLDEGLPLFNVRTLNEQMGISLFSARVAAVIMGSFGLLALALAAMGIYGILSYTVSQRTHEIGLRMALGASYGDVLRLVVGEGALLALLGIAIGLGCAFGVTRFMSSLLLGVTATDPVTFAAVSVLLLLVAAIAAVIPASRAAKVDPMVALRDE